ncbi:chemotaxis protein CheA [Sphingosinicella terrae]|uniref:chemotaxis protein CheA n=1 Tax=Sphingosinicella terrae TaxID=2172047 RepID=UPI000E0D39F1|nr:chemotaxis protein CheA [Sphingosinicella terrae]
MSDELDEIQAIFFEECVEGLATAEAGLSEMAAGDASAEVIAGVFRAVHSIKGGSGAFGHTALLTFSHRFENVLDEVRAGAIPPTAEVVKVMLGAFDILSDHVAAAREQSAPPADESVLGALDDLLANKGAGASAPPAAAAPPPAPATSPAAPSAAVPDGDEFGFVPVAAAVEEFDPFGFEPVAVSLDEVVELDPSDWTVRFGPSREALANGGEPILVIRELERLGGRVERVDGSSLPDLRDLDPENSYFVWTLSVPGSVAETEIAECFDFVAPDSLIEIVRTEAAAPAVRIEPALPEPAPLALVAEEIITVHAPPVAEAPPAPVPAPAPAIEPTPAAPAGERSERASDQPSQTIRVDLSKLDQLLNLVGELVIRGSILADRLSPADQERVELPQLSRLTRQIQDSVMSLRAQPIKQAFSRVPRMLRDLSAETGKQVVLDVAGETTEVDKSVIEKIGDPLTHMIRNAVDHGIEPPEERIAKGKPAEGIVHVSAEQKGARILVRVSDNGRGIDRARVKAKAIEKGIVAPDAQLSDEEIDQLICAPGFSTAETISNISGRGVGMDVVRSNVEALGGRVEISSVPGEGTAFTMILPLTLAILDGMVVRLAGQRYVLPLASVVESVRPEPGQVQRATPTSEVIELRGSYLPVRRLTDFFGLGRGLEHRPEDCLVIVVESDTAGLVGLMVDTIDDRREVVLKSLDQNLHPIRGLGGATILGDGSIALILDVEAIVSASSPTSKHNLKGLAA